MKHVLFLILCINIAGPLLGWLLTENNTWALSRLGSFFDRKPFNCRPCLTFHLLWMMYAIVAFVINSMLFGIIGFVLSLLVFALLYLNENSKIDD